MAPIPAGSNPNTQLTDKPVKEGPWNTASIVAMCIFGFLAFTITATLVGFYIHRRAERNKLPAEKRPASYHPFRTNTDKSSLLENVAPNPENDKTTMFSRERHSSVSLYVDSDAHKSNRESMETVSLIPLQITPAEEVHNPWDTSVRRSSGGSSVGSGVSGINRGSNRYSSGGSLALSPILDVEDSGRPQTRGRSVSTVSVRYYSSTPTEMAPQVPKIVHTPSI